MAIRVSKSTGLLKAINYSIIIIFQTLLISQVESKTNQEPVNFGFIFSLPWDISNTLRAPLAGPLSIILASGLAIILVIGMAASPLWYLFGLPPRRYHMHNGYQSKSNVAATSGRSFSDFHVNGDPYAFIHGNYSFLNEMQFPNSEENARNVQKFNESSESENQLSFRYPDFTESIFLFVPGGVEEECRKLLVCHSHGFLSFLPDYFLRTYRFLSKKLLNVPEDYRRAILKGLKDQGSCMMNYPGCTQDIVTIAKSTLFYNIPQAIREQWNLQMQK